MFKWFKSIFQSEIPAPPFKASKRTGKLMHGLWYGKITVVQAREKGLAWGLSEAQINNIIREATAAPSYWSEHSD